MGNISGELDGVQAKDNCTKHSRIKKVPTWKRTVPYHPKGSLKLHMSHQTV